MGGYLNWAMCFNVLHKFAKMVCVLRLEYLFCKTNATKVRKFNCSFIATVLLKQIILYETSLNFADYFIFIYMFHIF